MAKRRFLVTAQQLIEDGSVTVQRQGVQYTAYFAQRWDEGAACALVANAGDEGATPTAAYAALRAGGVTGYRPFDWRTPLGAPCVVAVTTFPNIYTLNRALAKLG